MVQNRQAFTLIELLVVVTIIVILLAILVPAMNKAIYEAEFASCAASYDGIGTGVINYASDNKQRYPARKAPRYVQSYGGVGAWVWVSSNSVLRWSDSTNETTSTDGSPAAEDRPPLKPYMAIKLLCDPMGDQVDLDAAESYSGGALVVSPNMLLWDTGYVGYGKMQKIGSRFNWKDYRTGKEYSSNLLAGDEDAIFTDYVVGTHQDKGGRLETVSYNGEEQIIADTGTSWRAWGTSWDAVGVSDADYLKMEFDRNFLRDDASVSSIRDTKSRNDERLATAPVWYDPDTYGDPNAEYRLLPKN